MVGNSVSAGLWADDTEPKRGDQSAHTAVQWQLLHLGSALGLSIRAARNDVGREFDGRSFAELPGWLDALPSQFDRATHNAIQLIDVLWLSGRTIIAAFEIENTTSVYSGLLRLSDLAIAQPNLRIPLYIAAPEDRRLKVLTELHRPTFAETASRLVDSCRFISFECLNENIARAEPFLPYLRFDFLDSFAEPCANRLPPHMT
jgi:hypothetical protein